MSDGPHRSLKMRRGWKKVAEYADKGAFAHEEIGAAIASACLQDAREELPDAVARCVREVFGGQQDSLFREQKVLQLEALRRLTAGQGFGQVFLDCAIQVASTGPAGSDAAVEAAENALEIWGARHARQIEEHYCRESTTRRAANVRSRIEEANRGAGGAGLARQLLKLDDAHKGRASQRKSGLDDGVGL